MVVVLRSKIQMIHEPHGLFQTRMQHGTGKESRLKFPYVINQTESRCAELKNTADNGVWLATTEEHHESLRREFPNMRSIQVLGKAVTGWQVLPVDAPDFEEAALRACELIVARDPRIGKVPRTRRASASRAKEAGRSSKRTRAPGT